MGKRLDRSNGADGLQTSSNVGKCCQTIVKQSPVAEDKNSCRQTAFKDLHSVAVSVAKYEQSGNQKRHIQA
jgi:hypothetical protein